MLDLKAQAYPLPEAIESAVLSGSFSFATSLMEHYLSDQGCPEELKERILWEMHSISSLKNQYPYTLEEAESLLAKAYPDTYKKGRISSYILSGALDWRFIEGKLMIERRVVENAAKRVEELVQCLSDDNQDADLTLRDDNIAFMKDKRRRKARIRLKAEVKPLSGFGSDVFINIPVVRKADSVEDIRFISASAGYIGVDDESSLFRSARFEKKLEKDDSFFIEFEYTINSTLNEDIECDDVAEDDKDSEYLKEEWPHIQFSPYLKALAHRITKNSHTLAEKARAIYDWITKNVKYSYVREYATISNLSEYAASNLKGDCGIQALLFITLCRISGVKARWESGWYTTPEGVFCHDWAEFHIPGRGWLFADCSFGGGGYRQGKLDRWNYYFGSRDIFRTPINGMAMGKLSGKRHLPADPIDNQRGEGELEERALERDELEWKAEVLDFQILEE